MIETEVKVNRQSGALWYNPEHNKGKTIQNYPALIVGLGATGSYLSMFLSRAGVQDFTLVDFDTLEPHNLGSQCYSFSQIGSYKTDAAIENLNSFSSSSNLYSYNESIEDLEWEGLNYHKIFCATLDKMEGRKYLFEQWLKDSPENSIFFDSRIGAEYWEVYALPKGNEDKIKRYRETLFGENEGNTGACNYQQSSHSACGAALKIVELTTNWITNIISEDDYLPFKVTNDIRTCTYGVDY